MKKWTWMLMLPFLLPACRSVRELNRETGETVKIVREVRRDTILRLQADSSLLRALLECDSAGQVVMKELSDYRSGLRLKIPEVKIRNNVLTVTAKVDSLSIFLTLRDRYETEQITTVRQTERTVEVNRLWWWQKALMGIGGLFLLGVAWRLSCGNGRR